MGMAAPMHNFSYACLTTADMAEHKMTVAHVF